MKMKAMEIGVEGLGSNLHPKLQTISISAASWYSADVEADVAVAGVPKKRTFKKFSFRGVDLDALLDMSTDELVKLFPATARRRFQRGLKRKPMALIKKLRKAPKPRIDYTVKTVGGSLTTLLGISDMIDADVLDIHEIP
ncbi:PREDICTED: 40S ribosomal protein S15-like [Fragaria vesca subsp. vesca]